MEEKLGGKYVIGRSPDFAVSFEETSPTTPMFFILSPGVDPLKDVEKHGNALAVLSLISHNILPRGIRGGLSEHTYCEHSCHFHIVEKKKT